MAIESETTQSYSSILPSHIHHKRITTYEEYQRVIDIIVGDGGYNLSFVIGRKGNGKTSAFEQIINKFNLLDDDDIAVDEDFEDDEDADADDEEGTEPVATKSSEAPIAYLNNAASAVGLYEWAYVNKGKLLVLDDVRKLFKDEGAVSILMQLCSTNERKHVWYKKQNQQLKTLGIPDHFVTNSRMVIISNTIDGIIDRLEPLLDRGRVFFFDPTVEELHHSWAKNWANPEVWNFIGDHIVECPYPSGRWYFHAAEEKRVNPASWQKELLATWRSDNPELGLFMEVQNDPTLNTENKRIAAFKRIGEQRRLPSSRATYFRYKNEYPHLLKPVVDAREKKTRDMKIAMPGTAGSSRRDDAQVERELEAPTDEERGTTDALQKSSV